MQPSSTTELNNAAMLPWELDDWFTDEGDRLVQQVANGTPCSDAIECAIYEVWLLDPEARNGGVSQYFYNNGREQWESCLRAAKTIRLETFAPFAEEVNEIINAASDRGAAIQARGPDGESAWESHQVQVVHELRDLCAGQVQR